MTEVQIHYVDKVGDEKILSLDESSKVLDLSARLLETVDLSNASECDGLLRIDLSENMAKEIDISPLAECKTIKEINLGFNLLCHLDLTPLKEIDTLETLRLNN
ncbi:MAG: hypothetical protein ACW98Y_16000, partial [Candidatus Thorarchaeota archaeon]